MSTVAFTTLIEPAELAAIAPSPDVLIMDCRHDLARPGWGAEAYAEGHLPGALHASLEHDLSGPITPASGRHPLPDPERFRATLSRWGVDERVQVVVYDQHNGAIAARLWWMLRWMGHARVALLNGGLAAWRAGDHALTSAPGVRAPRRFTGTPAASALLDAAAVLQGLETHKITLIDARAADRFAGRNETLDPVAGHVPGARNHPFTRNLDANGRFVDAAELKGRWLETLAGAAPSSAVLMCGSGVTACHDLLAMQLAQLPGARLYAGSWSEWIRDPRRPVATDPPHG